MITGMSSRHPKWSVPNLIMPLGQCLLPSARQSLLQLLPVVPPRPIHNLRNIKLVPRVLQFPQCLFHLLPSLADQLHLAVNQRVLQHLPENQRTLFSANRIHQHLPEDRSKLCQLLPVSTHKVGQHFPVNRFTVDQLLQINHRKVGQHHPVNKCKVGPLHPANHLKVV